MAAARGGLRAAAAAAPPVTRGLHSFKLELKLSTSGTHSCVKLGYVGH